MLEKNILVYFLEKCFSLQSDGESHTAGSESEYEPNGNDTEINKIQTCARVLWSVNVPKSKNATSSKKINVKRLVYKEN